MLTASKGHVFKLVLFREQGQYSVGLKKERKKLQTSAICQCDYHGLELVLFMVLVKLQLLRRWHRAAVDAWRRSWQKEVTIRFSQQSKYLESCLHLQMGQSIQLFAFFAEGMKGGRKTSLSVNKMSQSNAPLSLNV